MTSLLTNIQKKLGSILVYPFQHFKALLNLSFGLIRNVILTLGNLCKVLYTKETLVRKVSGQTVQIANQRTRRAY
jgi:hypothetical protein